MTFNSLFNAVTQNMLFGGVAAGIILVLMFRKANRVASTGNKAAMATWAAGPALMVLGSVVITGAVVGVALPRLQAMFTSVPVQNTVAVGNTLTAALDEFLFSGGGGGGMVVNTTPFNAAPSTDLVNNGVTVQPAATPFSPEDSNSDIASITTIEQAVELFKATPTESAITYIETFVADNSPTIAVTTVADGTYTVKRGDSLAKIAKAFYGDSNRWILICRANRLPDCNNLRAGMVLIIPPADGAAPASNQIVQQQPAVTQAVVVKPAQPVVVQAAVQRPVVVQAAQTTINNPAEAVAAFKAVVPAQPTAVPVVVPAVVVQALAKPTQTADEYIASFLETNNNNTVASADDASAGN